MRCQAQRLLQPGSVNFEYEYMIFDQNLWHWHIGGCLLHPTKRGCGPMGKVSCPTQRIAVVKSLKAMICKA